MIGNTPLDRAAVQRMMARLDGFARGLGLDEAAARTLVEQVAAEMAGNTEDDRLIEA